MKTQSTAPFMRLLVACVVGVFTFTSLGWANGINLFDNGRSVSGSIKGLNKISDQERSFEDLLKLPEEYGSIKTSYKGYGDEVVIHIQDAHINEEAQLNIGNIIKYYADKHGMSLVNLEGAEGELYTDIYKIFENREARKGAAEYFLKQGRLTGPEYMAVVESSDVILNGVEDRALYDENRDAYLSVMSRKERDEKVLADLYRLMDMVSRYVFSPEVRELNEKRLNYQAGGHELVSYVSALFEEAKAQGIDVGDYAGMHALLDLIRLEGEVEFEGVEKQLSSALREMKKKLPRESLSRFLSNMVHYRMKKMSKTAYFGYLMSEMDRLKAKDRVFGTKYSNVRKYIEYMKLYESVGVELFEEIEQLDQRVKEKLLTSEEEKGLDRLYRIYDIYEKMFSFNLTKQDVEFFYANREDFQSEKLASYLTPILQKHHFSYSLPMNMEVLDQDLPSVETFYAKAIERDEVMIKRSMEKAKEGHSVSAIVAGGFHTAGIEKYLYDNHISHITIAPRISQAIDERKEAKLYDEALRAKPLKITQVIEEAFLPQAGQQSLNDPRYQLVAWRAFKGKEQLEREDVAFALFAAMGVHEMHLNEDMTLSDLKERNPEAAKWLESSEVYDGVTKVTRGLTVLVLTDKQGRKIAVTYGEGKTSFEESGAGADLGQHRISFRQLRGNILEANPEFSRRQEQRMSAEAQNGSTSNDVDVQFRQAHVQLSNHYQALLNSMIRGDLDAYENLKADFDAQESLWNFLKEAVGNETIHETLTRIVNLLKYIEGVYARVQKRVEQLESSEIQYPRERILRVMGLSFVANHASPGHYDELVALLSDSPHLFGNAMSMEEILSPAGYQTMTTKLSEVPALKSAFERSIGIQEKEISVFRARSFEAFVEAADELKSYFPDGSAVPPRYEIYFKIRSAYQQFSTRKRLIHEGLIDVVLSEVSTLWKSVLELEDTELRKSLAVWVYQLLIDYVYDWLEKSESLVEMRNPFLVQKKDVSLWGVIGGLSERLPNEIAREEFAGLFYEERLEEIDVVGEISQKAVIVDAELTTQKQVRSKTESLGNLKKTLVRIKNKKIQGRMRDFFDSEIQRLTDLEKKIIETAQREKNEKAVQAWIYENLDAVFMSRLESLTGQEKADAYRISTDDIYNFLSRRIRDISKGEQKLTKERFQISFRALLDSGRMDRHLGSFMLDLESGDGVWGREYTPLDQSVLKRYQKELVGILYKLRAITEIQRRTLRDEMQKIYGEGVNPYIFELAASRIAPKYAVKGIYSYRSAGSVLLSRVFFSGPIGWVVNFVRTYIRKSADQSLSGSESQAYEAKVLEDFEADLEVDTNLESNIRSLRAVRASVFHQLNLEDFTALLGRLYQASVNPVELAVGDVTLENNDWRLLTQSEFSDQLSADEIAFLNDMSIVWSLSRSARNNDQYNWEDELNTIYPQLRDPVLKHQLAVLLNRDEAERKGLVRWEVPAAFLTGTPTQDKLRLTKNMFVSFVLFILSSAFITSALFTPKSSAQQNRSSREDSPKGKSDREKVENVEKDPLALPKLPQIFAPSPEIDQRISLWEEPSLFTVRHAWRWWGTDPKVERQILAPPNKAPRILTQSTSALEKPASLMIRGDAVRLTHVKWKTSYEVHDALYDRTSINNLTGVPDVRFLENAEFVLTDESGEHEIPVVKFYRTKSTGLWAFAGLSFRNGMAVYKVREGKVANETQVDPMAISAGLAEVFEFVDGRILDQSGELSDLLGQISQYFNLDFSLLSGRDKLSVSQLAKEPRLAEKPGGSAQDQLALPQWVKEYAGETVDGEKISLIRWDPSVLGEREVLYRSPQGRLYFPGVESDVVRSADQLQPVALLFASLPGSEVEGTDAGESSESVEVPVEDRGKHAADLIQKLELGIIEGKALRPLKSMKDLLETEKKEAVNRQAVRRALDRIGEEKIQQRLAEFIKLQRNNYAIDTSVVKAIENHFTILDWSHTVDFDRQVEMLKSISRFHGGQSNVVIVNAPSFSEKQLAVIQSVPFKAQHFLDEMDDVFGLGLKVEDATAFSGVFDLLLVSEAGSFDINLAAELGADSIALISDRVHNYHVGRVVDLSKFVDSLMVEVRSEKRFAVSA